MEKCAKMLGFEVSFYWHVEARLLNSVLRNSSDSVELRSFITVMTTVHYVRLSWSRWIHSMPTHLIALISILILSLWILHSSSKWLLSLKFLCWKAACSSLYHTHSTCHSILPSLFDDLNNICQGSKIMKLLTEIFPTPLLLCLGPKHLPQHPPLKWPPVSVFPIMWGTRF